MAVPNDGSQSVSPSVSFVAVPQRSPIPRCELAVTPWDGSESDPFVFVERNKTDSSLTCRDSSVSANWSRPTPPMR